MSTLPLFGEKVVTPNLDNERILSDSLDRELTLGEIKSLLDSEPVFWEKVYSTADEVKRSVFGNKIQFYVPIYISSCCVDNCIYCDYRRENPNLIRKRLGFEEFVDEFKYLDGVGYTQMELVSASDPLFKFDDFLAFTRFLKSKGKHVMMNNRSLRLEEYKALKDAGMSESWLFMETYDPVLYSKLHPPGPKHSYDVRLESYELMAEAGLDIGVAFLSGLSQNWKEEVLSVIAHARYLRDKYGVKLTFSTPRFKHAPNAPLSDSPYSIQDDAFRLTVALYRLGLHECNINVSTRELIGLLEKLWVGGASLTNPEAASIPGGYSLGVKGSQFAHFSYNRDLFVSRIKKLGLEPVL